MSGIKVTKKQLVTRLRVQSHENSVMRAQLIVAERAVAALMKANSALVAHIRKMNDAVKAMEGMAFLTMATPKSRRQ